ncbi:DUF4424 domain-containing protein [Acinetobacter courvalinii]|uniref:DUF4424 domain-containing protein n=1 Tax=Acinetobacter courvalinii TaxID=280147 RepID=UPI0021CD73F7|nr:DUF4424 domain-containing protein [Acinetobacter courvalinii]MCU4390058.1 DUF4424 domain-containing protein [Acinetobacter courvalinii]
MKKMTVVLVYLASSSMYSLANDSTGYVGTGGIQYLKNAQITMQSENLFISKKLIKVDYVYKNLSKHDITETVLFPLPHIDNFFEADFAHTEALLKSFKIIVDGQHIKPEMHVRTFIQKDDKSPLIDSTEAFQQCSFSQVDMLNPWARNNDDYEYYQDKLRQCKQPQIQKILAGFNKDDVILWSSQVIYSWKQTFKANSMTKIYHAYKPLVGGSVALYPDEYNQQFCMDKSFKQGLKKASAEHSPFSALSYILTTGANWAKPIEKFKLTIERDHNELVSFCWNGKVEKISPTQFQMVKHNFIPAQDLDIIFVSVK